MPLKILDKLNSIGRTTGNVVPATGEAPVMTKKQIKPATETLEQKKQRMIEEIKSAYENPRDEEEAQEIAMRKSDKQEETAEEQIETEQAEEVYPEEEEEEFEDVKQKTEEELKAEAKSGAEGEIIGFELGLYGFEYKVRSSNPFFKIGTCRISQ
jgi:hypothetical protein